jgi:hypothetical protein
MPHSSKKKGHFRKKEKPEIVHRPRITRKQKERTMEKTPEKDPMGPRPVPTTPKPGEQPDDAPKPGRPPHWHEGDPEPEDKEA